MSSRSLTSEQALTLLAATPSRLATLTAGLAPAHLQTAPTPDEWSANDVLAHLRACSDVWGSCIAAILAQDRPRLQGINPRAWIKKTNYRDLDFPASFPAFARQRAELLAVLEPLSHEDWSRTASVTDMVGNVFERTVLYYAERLARHERTHLKQIERIVSTPHVRSR